MRYVSEQPSFHCDHCGLAGLLLLRFYSNNICYTSYCTLGHICHWLDDVELAELIKGHGEGVVGIDAKRSGRES